MHAGCRLATVTGSVQQDMCVIESCIGVGEVAISDHRSSCPTPQELGAHCQVSAPPTAQLPMCQCTVHTAAGNMLQQRCSTLHAMLKSVDQYLLTSHVHAALQAWIGAW